MFAALAGISLVGASLRWAMPDLDIDLARRICGRLVLGVMLPALNIEVISTANLGPHLWQVPVTMAAVAILCVGVGLLVFSPKRMDGRLAYALVLGCAFGNVTYLGLPLLRGLFPESQGEVTAIAILCEITVTSLDLITAAALAGHLGHIDGMASVRNVAGQLLRFPLLWAVAFAFTLRWLEIPIPPFVLSALHLLGQSVSGLMLLVLGMALKPAAVVTAFRLIGVWWPLLPIKLVLSPLAAAAIGSAFGMPPLQLQATTLQAAMPPQLFTLVAADRFGLDTETLAAAVAFLTIVSFLTLPFLFWLTG